MHRSTCSWRTSCPPTPFPPARPPPTPSPPVRPQPAPPTRPRWEGSDVEYLKIGVFAGLLLAIATAAGGVVGFLLGIVFAAVGAAVGGHLGGVFDLRELLDRGPRRRR